MKLNQHVTSRTTTWSRTFAMKQRLEPTLHFCKNKTEIASQSFVDPGGPGSTGLLVKHLQTSSIGCTSCGLCWQWLLEFVFVITLRVSKKVMPRQEGQNLDQAKYLYLQKPYSVLALSSCSVMFTSNKGELNNVLIG